MAEILGVPASEILTWVVAAVVVLILVWIAVRFLLRIAVRFFSCAIAIIVLFGLIYLLINYLS